MDIGIGPSDFSYEQGRKAVREKAQDEISGLTTRSLGIKVILLILFLAFLLGGNAVATKIALREMSPFMIAGLRCTIGAIGILLWSLVSRQELKPRREDIPYLAFLSAILVVWLCALNLGMKFTLAGRASVFVNTNPFFVAILAHFLIPGDRLSLKKITGIAIAFLGVVLVFWNKMSGSSPRGDGIVLMSGFLLGVLAVSTKRISQHIDPHKLLFWELVFALTPFIILSLIFEGAPAYSISIAPVIAILYQGVLVAGFSGMIWTLLLKRYSASKITIFFSASPIFGVILSNLILEDPITSYLIIGTLLVALGIYVVNKCSEGFGVCG